MESCWRVSAGKRWDRGPREKSDETADPERKVVRLVTTERRGGTGGPERESGETGGQERKVTRQRTQREKL